jgi:hypothetical protein
MSRFRGTNVNAISTLATKDNINGLTKVLFNWDLGGDGCKEVTVREIKENWLRCKLCSCENCTEFDDTCHLPGCKQR